MEAIQCVTSVSPTNVGAGEAGDAALLDRRPAQVCSAPALGAIRVIGAIFSQQPASLGRVVFEEAYWGEWFARGSTSFGGVAESVSGGGKERR